MVLIFATDFQIFYVDISLNKDFHLMYFFLDYSKQNKSCRNDIK